MLHMKIEMESSRGFLYVYSFARVAELADALDLGSSEATPAGSSPALRTNLLKMDILLTKSTEYKGVFY